MIRFPRGAHPKRAREPETGFSALSELTWDAIVVVDRAGRIVEANPQSARLLGMEVAALDGLLLRDLIPSEDIRLMLQLLEGARADRRHEVRIPLRRASGEIVSVEARAVSRGDGMVAIALRLIEGARSGTRQPPDDAPPVRGYFDRLPIPALVFDAGGTVLAVNAAWTALFGLPPAAATLVGANVFQNPGILGPTVRGRVEGALKGNIVEIPAVEWMPPVMPGAAPAQTRIVRLILLPFADEDSASERVMALALDLTEQRKVEDALRDSGSRYRALIEETPEALFLLEDGVFRFVNRQFCQVFGMNKADLINRRGPLALCAEEDRTLLANYISDRLALRSARATAIFRGLRADGVSIDCEIHANRILLNGKPVLLGGVRDITDQRRTRETMRFQSKLFEHVQDAIVATDWDGRIIYCNAAAESIYGWRSRQVVGRLFTDVVRARGTEPVPADLNQVLNRQGTWRGELQHRTADGRLLWVAATLSVLGDDQNRAIGAVGVFRDITEQKELEEQLLQAQKMESIGTLAGGIAHDFNNILGSIVGYLGLLKEDLSDDPSALAYLDIVERSAHRASDLTRQLLGFARKGKFEVRAVDIGELCRDVANLLRSAMDKTIDLQVHIPANLPRAEGDANQLQQVILNLCTNARDAMPHGGTLRLSLAEALADDQTLQPLPRLRRYVVLTVSDTGAGMDDATRERMFEPFFTTKDPGKGTGLGLAMVYGIVRNHGGFIDVRSEIGKGTTVQVYLPVSHHDQGAGAEEAARDVAEGKGELILIVDDEEPLRNLVRDVLSRRSYRVLVAADGREALEAYRTRGPEIALVILDMTMPGMSGQELFDALRTQNPTVRVLLCSGYAQEGTAQDVLRRGALGFLQKPYLITELATKVRDILDQS
jgi:PAS domain S-box-containing protein